mmetsp:Transcript_13134/g.34866  ORF Transcript_13134/g.34866 Transcript_13134/m.34866 type:complete len:286 (-) Transcript_13134:38-895(-)
MQRQDTLNSLKLSSLNQSLGSSGASSRHRRHQSDPFGSSLAPMSDSDMAAFLAAEGDEDALMPGSLLSFDDADLGDIGDLLLPTPSGPQLPAWPSPRTPGRKHRRTISEPALNFQFVKNDVHSAPAPPPVRRGVSDEGYIDDATHPLILGDGLRLDSFDLELDERALPPMPPPPAQQPKPQKPSRAARSTGRRRKPTKAADPDFVDPDTTSISPAPSRKSKKDGSETKKYRCSRCGQIKANHVCPFLKYNSVATGVQADPSVTVTTAGCKTLKVRGRFVGAAVMA